MRSKTTLAMGLAWLGACGWGAGCPARGDVEELPILQPAIVPLAVPAGVHVRVANCYIAPDGRTGLIATQEDAIKLWPYLVATAGTWMAYPALGSSLWFLWRVGLLLGRPPRAARCRRCDYPLTGLRSQTCPECGVTLSARNVLRAGQRRGTWRGLLASAILPVGYMSVFVWFPGWAKPWLSRLATIAEWRNQTAYTWATDRPWFQAEPIRRVRRVDFQRGVLGHGVYTHVEVKQRISLHWREEDSRLMFIGDKEVILWDAKTSRKLDRMDGVEIYEVGNTWSLSVERQGDRLVRRSDRRPRAPDGAGFLVFDRALTEHHPTGSSPDTERRRREIGMSPPTRHEVRTVDQDGGVARRFQFPRTMGKAAVLDPSDLIAFDLSEDNKLLLVIWDNHADVTREMQVYDTVTGDLVHLARIPGESVRGIRADNGTQIGQVDDLLLVPCIAREDLVVYHRPSGRWIARLAMDPWNFQHRMDFGVPAARLVRETGQLLLVPSVFSPELVRYDLSEPLKKANGP